MNPEKISYQVKRSRRKTVAIHITREARVEVRAPLRFPQREIDAFVGSKAGWIRRNLTQAEQKARSRAAFAVGDSLLLLGREYPVERTEGGEASFNGTRFRLPAGTAQEEKARAAALYRALAREELVRRVELWSERMGVSPSGVRISGAAHRWGSCSGRNALNFSWRLVLAPPEAVDYVVVHELAHIRRHDHSPAFWAAVGAVLPDYPRRQELLRALQDRLEGEDWDG